MTITRRNRPIELTDAPEHRSIPMDRVALRGGSDDSNELVLVGYASTFEPYEMYGGPETGGWIEQIDRNAFNKTLREKPDLHLLINHAGMPLARTKSKTLDLSVDDHGLKVEARLDRTDPDVQRLETKMRRGDMDEMSFAFRVKAQEWGVAEGYEHLEDDLTFRKITEVSLHKGDVSIVNFGANPTTHAEIKSVTEALKVIAEADERELCELRSESDVVNLKVAQEKLAAARGVEADQESADQVQQVQEALADVVSRHVEEEQTEDDELVVDVTEAAEALRSTLTSVVEAVENITGLITEEQECAESEDAPRGMSLQEALALQGIDDESASLSIAAAEALMDA